MYNRSETGRSFGVSVKITPEHIEEALKKTEAKKDTISNVGYIAVLGSIAYRDQCMGQQTTGNQGNTIGFSKE